MQILIILVLSFVVSSCAKLEYLEQGLTLKGYSEEKDAQGRQVEERDRKVDLLLQKISSREDLLQSYPTGQALIAAFDQPVLVWPYTEDGQKKERWLYRYQTKYFNVPKVYFLLDAQGRVTGWTVTGVDKKDSKPADVFKVQ